jgi:hypothetical protein
MYDNHISDKNGVSLTVAAGHIHQAIVAVLGVVRDCCWLGSILERHTSDLLDARGRVRVGKRERRGVVGGRRVKLRQICERGRGRERARGPQVVHGLGREQG